MPKINNEVQKDQLALHLASGGGVADWARANRIPDRTVYSWSRSPEVRDRTESIRRAVLAEAVKQLGAHAAAAAGRSSSWPRTPGAKWFASRPPGPSWPNS